MNSVLSENLTNQLRYLPHLPSPKQRRALEYWCTELLYGGAAGGGKSDFLLMAALQGVTTPGYAALLFRRTHTDLALPGALMDRSHQWWSGTDAHWDGQQKRWRFPLPRTLDGAPLSTSVGFGYMDSPDDHLRYQSAEFQFVGLDEASQFTEKQGLYMLSRLRAPTGFGVPCRLRNATNPGGIGHEWLQKRYRIPEAGCATPIEQRKNGELLRVFVPSLAIDNPGLDVPNYLDKLRLLDPITRAQLERGEWLIDASGLVYYCYSDACHVDALPAIIPASEWLHVLGVDFGSTNDATAFAVCSFSLHEPEIYLSWVEQHQRMSPQEAAVRAEELSEQFGGFVTMVGDAGGLGAAYVLEMQKHWAIPITAAEKQHKAAFVRLLNGEMANNRFKVVAPLCQPFCDQAKGLLWADAAQTRENQSQHNDSTDAALYAWRECRHYSAREREAPAPVDAHKQRLIEQAEQRDWARLGPAINPWF